jgi:hypothetical protein
MARWLCLWQRQIDLQGFKIFFSYFIVFIAKMSFYNLFRRFAIVVSL